MIARGTKTWELATEALLNQDHLFRSFLTFDGACSSFSFRFFSSSPLSSLLPFSGVKGFLFFFSSFLAVTHFLQKNVACCCSSQGVGVLRSLLPTSLFEHLSTDQENHRRKKDHTQRSPCSRGPFGCVATACVSSPRDWAVSISLHMQRDLVISLAPLHLGAPSSTSSNRSALTAIHWQWPSLGICLRRQRSQWSSMTSSSVTLSVVPSRALCQVPFDEIGRTTFPVL